jgi:hypothetical protein
MRLSVAISLLTENLVLDQSITPMGTPLPALPLDLHFSAWIATHLHHDIRLSPYSNKIDY